MNIIVCVKRVPLTQEVDLEIDASKRNVRSDMLAYVMNEWDNYAIEEAILLKEKLEGTVTAVTIGGEDDEEVLRRCLAMGADKAIRIDPGSHELDAFTISRILAEVIKGLEDDAGLELVVGLGLPCLHQLCERGKLARVAGVWTHFSVNTGHALI